MAKVIATSASPRLFGADLNPEEISRQLGRILATAEHKDDVTEPKGNIVAKGNVVARTGGWKPLIEQENGHQLGRQIGNCCTEPGRISCSGTT